MNSLKSSKKCISPWINLTILPTGSVRPCCIAQTEYGNINNNSLSDVINSEQAKNFRKEFLAGNTPNACLTCVEREDIGHSSLRDEFWEKFSKYEYLIDESSGDGSLDTLEFKYFDLRLSNLCNFKCRICHHELSSSWYEDTKALNPEYKSKKLISADINMKTLLPIVIEHCEEVYFAGGEPLLHKEQFEILSALAKAKRFDVKLSYHTNLSTLNFIDRNYLTLWKQFKNVSIAMSLDDFGQRAEYTRTGTKFEVIEKNLIELNDEHSNIYFFFFPTISVFNLLGLDDFLNYLFEKKLLKNGNLHFNLLTWPQKFDIKNLPIDFKEKGHRILDKCIRKYSEFIKESEFQILKVALDRECESAQFDKFLDENKQLDLIRDEELTHYLPEFTKLLEDNS
jgi:radical SAM protein with 4Fe4S-binding SPASM domain